MAEIFPFIGTRFNSRLIEDKKTALAPPYYLLTSAQREEIRQTNPVNILNLIPSYPDDGDDDLNSSYLKAASALQTWRRDGLLVNDNHKSFYYYEQSFGSPVGKCKKRGGLFALVNLNRQIPVNLCVEGSTPFFNKSHHLKLLRAAKCNFTPIPMIYEDPAQAFASISESIVRSKPWEEIQTDSGDVHRLWVVNKKEHICRIREFFKEKPLFMVEGHEHYETAQAFRDQQREVTGKKDGMQPFDYILSFLFNFSEDQVATRPIHRVLSQELGSGVDLEEIFEDLRENFTLKEIKVNIKEEKKAAGAVLKAMEEKSKREVFGMVLPDGRAFTLTLKSKRNPAELFDEDARIGECAARLPVSILYYHIIRQVWIGNPELELENEDIVYYRDADAAIKMAAERNASAVFLLKSCPIEMLRKVMNSGEMIPPYTASLSPPLPTGLIIRDMYASHR